VPLETGYHRQEHNLTSVQCLRGVAALMIVLFHAITHYENTRSPQGNVLTLTAGVDIFFVISGFLMLYAFHRSPARTGERFFVDRLVRITPMYWLLSLVVVLIALILPNAMKNGKLEFWHALLSFFYVPVLHPVSGMYEPILIPGWTLNYEVFFYAIFAVGLWLAKGRMAVLFSFTVLTISTIAMLPQVIAVPGILSFYTAGIIFEFVYGIVICLIFLNTPRLSFPVCIGLIAIGIFGLWLSLGYGHVFPRQVTAGIPAALIFLGTVNLRVDPEQRTASVIRLIGDSSYSLYLVHPLVVSALGQTWRKLAPATLVGGQTMFATLAALVCIGVAIPLYIWVEEPIIEFAKRRFGGRPSRKVLEKLTAENALRLSPDGLTRLH
jgi:exopolysaccharide production protein ExoZ